jgi:hypothetical protein
MKTQVTHRLVGYDPQSGRVAVEHPIPPEHLAAAKVVADFGFDDADAALCYKLNKHQAREIADTIGAAIDADALNFYMEGFAEYAAMARKRLISSNRSKAASSAAFSVEKGPFTG